MPPLPRHPLISTDSTVRSGRPYLTGTRISVADVLDWLNSGVTEAALLRDFPDLTPEMIHACLRYSSDRGHWSY
ncbi:DUF433 domain-containing protein [Hymenobacter sp. UV11]|uniref:DUF433 domain-containing protein n=1 Tax=Hymenobacter sp. UV11 TaxID=1849735 RepID=UPI00106211B0|nr:DUF433 domain-containing protein [Hymenobacter sp. UV11]TDN38444.1 hypothetical protein A8B98_24125 [Hymenobacter sp. UV11]TFZ67954.1 DUF433 domain-containing protein [Hymenobacter sp. UV11]